MKNIDDSPKRSEVQESLIPTATPFVLPLFVFLVIASFYPDFAGSYENQEWGESVSFGVTAETWRYIVMIGLQVIIATGLLIYFRKIYIGHFPLRLSPWSILVGALGVALWIGVCQLQLEPRLLAWVGINHNRPAFNPFTIDDPPVRILFLGLRFVLLALIVPIIEELFLRGWLVRWVQDPNWESVKLNGLSTGAWLTPSLYGVLTHPAEAIAAFLWFGLVTWLMARTGNLWDCVAAHAVTNLLLGIYVVQFQQWQLW